MSRPFPLLAVVVLTLLCFSSSLLLHAAAFYSPSRRPKPPPEIDLPFLLQTIQHTRMITQLNVVFSVTDSPMQINRHVVMQKQTIYNTPPGKWVTPILHGWGSDKIKVFLRHDNAYFLGFRMVGAPGGVTLFWRGKEHMYPGSVALPLGENYGELVGGHMQLAYVVLGRNATRDAVSILAHYHLGTVSNHDLGLAAATICLTLSESMRIKPIQLIISRGWDSEGGVTIGETNAMFTVLWGPISHILEYHSLSGRWDTGGQYQRELEKAGVVTREDALAVVHMLVRSRKLDI